jgi:ATP-dependent exoDNAse (exonuclease V) alpha subunit
VTDAMQDPWSGLDDPKALPAEADAAARAAGLAPDDPRRAAGLTSWLVHRATLNGSTCLPAEVLARALAGFGVDDPVPGVRLADDQGRIVALPEERLAAPAQVAAQEETVADELARLLENTPPERAENALDAIIGSGVSVVVAAPGTDGSGWTQQLQRHATGAGLRVGRAVAERAAASAGVLADAEVAVIEGAHRLQLADAAAVLTKLGDSARLVLLGDPDQLPAYGPGRVLLDVVSSGVVPVEQLPPDPGSMPAGLLHLANAVRQGRLPVVEPDGRDVVVVPVDDPATVVVRLRQLLSTSIPRTFDVRPEDVLVLTPGAPGVLGADAMRRGLADSGARVSTVQDAAGERAEAVVLVTPAEATALLSRALVLTAVDCAVRHLSVVHQAGPALAQAVAARPQLARRTRLRGLLREAVLGPEDGPEEVPA